MPDSTRSPAYRLRTIVRPTVTAGTTVMGTPIGLLLLLTRSYTSPSTGGDRTYSMGAPRHPVSVGGVHWGVDTTATIDVETAFDNGTISIGTDADPDAYVTDTDVTTTGVKICTFGANKGYNASTSQIKAFYTGTSAVGKAIVNLPLHPTPNQ